MSKVHAVTDIKTPRDCEKVLDRNGAEKVRQSGSHAIWRFLKWTFCIPMHNGDLKPGLKRAIIKDMLEAGLRLMWWAFLVKNALAVLA